MAVNILANPKYGYELVALCGVSHTLLEQAEEAGIQIAHGATGALTIKSKDGGKVYGLVPFKASAVTLLKNGTLGPASKESVKYQVEKGLNAAISEAGHSYNAPAPSFYDAEDTQSLVAQSVQSTGAKSLGALLKEKLNKDAQGEVAPTDFSPFQAKPKKENMKTFDQMMKLNVAKKLYQPVFGTSGGSVYYVAAMFDGMNLALRRQASQVSFRVEGAKLSKYLPKLESLGFSLKEDYASVHLGLSTDVLLEKTFGAMVGAIGFEKLKSVGNPLEAKG